jgi:hypothetical protein
MSKTLVLFFNIAVGDSNPTGTFRPTALELTKQNRAINNCLPAEHFTPLLPKLASCHIRNVR